MITEPTPDAETYVTFFVGGHHFCISANEVEEVMLAPEITAVPLAPSHLAGLINLRGQIIPALCTAKLCAVDVPGGAKDPAGTAKATEEITQKIETIQRDTQGAVSSIAEIAKIIAQIDGVTNSIAAAVEEQTVTTNEINRNVSDTAGGANEIAQNIAGVASAAQDTTKGATDTQSAALALRKMAADLQAAVSRFQS
jgi:uncharacterized protein YoxC